MPAGTVEARGKVAPGRVGPGDPLLDLADARSGIRRACGGRSCRAGREAAGRRRGRSRGCSSGRARACGDRRSSPVVPRPAKRRSKTEPGVDLLGHRRVGRPPGDVRGIGATIARVAVARLAAALDAQLQRGQPRLAADLLGGDLVDRDPRVDVGAVGLERMDPVRKQESDRAWSPPPSPSASALCWARPGEDQQIVPERLQGLESRRQRESGPFFLGPPVGHVHAVGNVEESHPPGLGPTWCRVDWPERRLAPSPPARAGRWPCLPLSGPCGGKVSGPSVMVVPLSSGQGFVTAQPRRFRNGSLSDDLQHQPAEPVLVGCDGIDDLVDGTDVVVFQPSAQGVGQQLLGQAAGELALARLEDRLQLARARGTIRRRGACPRRRPANRPPCRARRRWRRSSPGRSPADRAGCGTTRSSGWPGAAPSAGGACQPAFRLARSRARAHSAAAAAEACPGSARAPTCPASPARSASGFEVTVRMLACVIKPPRCLPVSWTRRNSSPVTPGMP